MVDLTSGRDISFSNQGLIHRPEEIRPLVETLSWATQEEPLLDKEKSRSGRFQSQSCEEDGDPVVFSFILSFEGHRIFLFSLWDHMPAFLF